MAHQFNCFSFLNGYRGIAQLVEQRSPKPRAEGSSPSAPAKEKSPKTLINKGLTGFFTFFVFYPYCKQSTSKYIKIYQLGVSEGVSKFLVFILFWINNRQVYKYFYFCTSDPSAYRLTKWFLCLSVPSVLLRSKRQFRLYT